VVDTGPYRLVRHPIDSGLLLTVLGSFLMDGPMFWLVALAAGTVGLCWTARAEERLLTPEMGEADVNYWQGTRVLIP